MIAMIIPDSQQKRQWLTVVMCHGVEATVVPVCHDHVYLVSFQSSVNVFVHYASEKLKLMCIADNSALSSDQQILSVKRKGGLTGFLTLLRVLELTIASFSPFLQHMNTHHSKVTGTPRCSSDCNWRSHPQRG